MIENVAHLLQNFNSIIVHSKNKRVHIKKSYLQYKETNQEYTIMGTEIELKRELLFFKYFKNSSTQTFNFLFIDSVILLGVSRSEIGREKDKGRQSAARLFEHYLDALQ